MYRRLLLVALMSSVLAGCGSSDSASMKIEGSDHALILVRDKPFIWSSGWDLAMVVSRLPDCMRRHHLRHAGDGTFKMEVYRTDTGGWIMRQGKKWYVADTRECQLQQYKEPPPEPGVLVGVFTDKTGEYQFIQSPDLKKQADDQ